VTKLIFLSLSRKGCANFGTTAASAAVNIEELKRYVRLCTFYKIET